MKVPFLKRCGGTGRHYPEAAGAVQQSSVCVPILHLLQGVGVLLAAGVVADGPAANEKGPR
ncbi:hypothetical protein [Zoogloea sp. 1C4]|uniref:hypothetical protein n=1 Tax=Zoogloea sp. 1C4 TaxID=2570190 RepID=UPI00129282B9|nr:hypothetical protein [Zoogloea sp. 1C4]